MDSQKAKSLKALMVIPGVGKSVAGDLRNLGITAVEQLKGKDPEELYQELCALQGLRIDRCMLYVFRCAIYYAETANPDPERLKWWHWKD
ncbi:MAG: helix-hairpin-helix domain-containing protein [Calditrichaeota bacterium]|nr:helix-hairpin-helix domain-containing protein [Calditrichota bacterium]